MSAGPLRRTTGSVGLLALSPIAAMLVMGSLTPEVAALRALAVLAAVVAVGNLARWLLATIVGALERDAGVDDDHSPRRPAHGAANTAADGDGKATSSPTGVNGGPEIAAGLGRRATDAAPNGVGRA